MAEKFDNAMLVKTFFIHKQKRNYFSTKGKFPKTKHQHIVNQTYSSHNKGEKFSFFVFGGQRAVFFFSIPGYRGLSRFGQLRKRGGLYIKKVWVSVSVTRLTIQHRSETSNAEASRCMTHSMLTMSKHGICTIIPGRNDIVM